MLGRHRHGAMIDVKAGFQRFESEAFGCARIGHGGDTAAAGPSHGVEVDIVLQPAVFVVLEAYLHRVANAHPHERARHLSVEGPIAVGSAIVEIAHPLDGLKLDAHGLRYTIPDCSRQIGRCPDDRGGSYGDSMRERQFAGSPRRMGCTCHEVHRLADRSVSQAEQQGRTEQDACRTEKRAIVSIAREFHGSGFPFLSRYRLSCGDSENIGKRRTRKN